MNERQTAHFLWVWSRRRRRGRIKTVLLGAAIGVGAGVAFALLFTFFIGLGGAPVTVNRAGLAPFFAWVLDQFGPFGMIVAMASAPFGAMSASVAFGLFSRQERQYQALLSAGHPVPEQAPVLSWKDWLPTIAFFVFMAALIGGALVAAYFEAV